MFDVETRILIVDDMQIVRQHIERLFQELGFRQLILAADVASAFNLIQNEKPSFGLVLADYDMNESGGLDLYRRIRADSRFEKLPFLLLGLEAEEPQLKEAKKTGVTTYLLKPFTAPVLKSKLAEMSEP